MILEEGAASQTNVVVYNLNLLLTGVNFLVLILPLILLIWRQSRVTGLAVIVGGLAPAFSKAWLFRQTGLSEVTALPYVIFWTPLALYLFIRMRAPDMPVWPARIITGLFILLLGVLILGYRDLLRALF